MKGRAVTRRAFDFNAPPIVVADALNYGKPYPQAYTLC